MGKDDARKHAHKLAKKHALELAKVVAVGELRGGQHHRGRSEAAREVKRVANEVKQNGGGARRYKKNNQGG
jgi:hypothetical protein